MICVEYDSIGGAETIIECFEEKEGVAKSVYAFFDDHRDFNPRFVSVKEGDLSS